MKEPKRKRPTIASVKKIFRRRSGVLKILPNALNTSSPCFGPKARGFELTCLGPPRKSPQAPAEGTRSGYSLMEPPALTIFSAACFETLSTLTVRATLSSPSAKTLTFWFLRTAPLATKSVTVTSPPLG